MGRPLPLRSFALFSALCFIAIPAAPQSLDMRWKKDFPKEVSWYVRTSPGILLVRAGKSLTALDGLDGRQLWALPDVASSEVSASSAFLPFERGKNLLEVPGMGVLLLNHVRLPGDSDGRLIAFNLITGERLWDHPQVDDLMTAVPLDGTREIVLVSMRVQRKVLSEIIAAEVIVSAALRTPIFVSPFPFRFQFERLDPLTGKVEWSSEYPHTFAPCAVSVTAFADHLFLYVCNNVLGSVDLANGKRMWEDASNMLGTNGLPLPLDWANGRLVYGLKHVQAVDAATKQVQWEIKGLGKITGISARDGVVVAMGNENIAAVDSKTGAELWRKKTHGHTTNLLWDKQSDAMVYVDGKGLHSAERTTGKSLLDAPLHVDSNPLHIRLASSGVVVTIATDGVCAYDLNTGKKLFAAGKLTGAFNSYAFLDFWPMPVDGQGLIPVPPRTPGTGDWNGVGEGSMFSAEARSRFAGFRTATEGMGDAFETESETGTRKIWWIDPESEQQVGFQLTGMHHDVSRSLGMIFAVDGRQVWGASFSPKQKPGNQ